MTAMKMGPHFLKDCSWLQNCHLCEKNKVSIFRSRILTLSSNFSNNDTKKFFFSRKISFSSLTSKLAKRRLNLKAAAEEPTSNFFSEIQKRPKNAYPIIAPLIQRIGKKTSPIFRGRPQLDILRPTTIRGGQITRT